MFRDNFIGAIENSMAMATQALDSLRNTFRDGFTNLITGRGSVGDLVMGLLDNVTSMIINQFSTAITSGLFGGFGGGGGGSILGSLFGSFLGFQEGGRPQPGRPAIVGEAGPEIFIPDSAGTIIPNDEIGGTTINFNITGDVSRQTISTIQREAPMISNLVAQNLQDQGRLS